MEIGSPIISPISVNSLDEYKKAIGDIPKENDRTNISHRVLEKEWNQRRKFSRKRKFTLSLKDLDLVEINKILDYINSRISEFAEYFNGLEIINSPDKEAAQPITDEEMKKISNMDCLEILIIPGANSSDYESLLKIVPNLKYLNIASCCFGQETIQDIINSGKNLIFLDISANGEYDSIDGIRIPPKRPLEELISARNLTSDITMFESSTNRLKKIDLSNNTIECGKLVNILVFLSNTIKEVIIKNGNIDNESLFKEIFELNKSMPKEIKFAHLKSLDLSQNDLHSDQEQDFGLIRLLKAAPNLQKLKLEDCSLDDRDLRSLSYALTEREVKLPLEELDLANNNFDKVIEFGLLQVIDHIPSLKIINLTGCNVSLPQLERLSYNIGLQGREVELLTDEATEEAVKISYQKGLEEFQSSDIAEPPRKARRLEGSEVASDYHPSDNLHQPSASMMSDEEERRYI